MSSPIEIAFQILAGILGGIAVGRATKEHSLGVLGDAIAGAVGAGIGSLFLQDPVLSMVNAGAVETASSPATRTVLILLAAAVGGAVLALLAGMAKHLILEHKPH